MAHNTNRPAQDSVRDCSESMPPLPHCGQSQAKGSTGSSMAAALGSPEPLQVLQAPSPDKAAQLYFPDEAYNALAYSQLRRRLSDRPANEILDIVMATVKQCPMVGFYLDHQIQERTRIEAEQRSQKEAAWKQTPEGFSFLLACFKTDVCEIFAFATEYTFEESQARATDAFASALARFHEVLDRCPSNASPATKAIAIETMLKMWIIPTTGSRGPIPARCQCESWKWEKPCLELWLRTDKAIIQSLATKESLLKEFINAAVCWTSYHVCEKMFNTVIMDLWRATNVKLAHCYEPWIDARDIWATMRRNPIKSTAMSPTAVKDSLTRMNESSKELS